MTDQREALAELHEMRSSTSSPDARWWLSLKIREAETALADEIAASEAEQDAILAAQDVDPDETGHVASPAPPAPPCATLGPLPVRQDPQNQETAAYAPAQRLTEAEAERAWRRVNPRVPLRWWR